jgi:hypothetical protein
MSEGPETIWARADNQAGWLWPVARPAYLADEHADPMQSYTRTDISEAAKAAAYEAGIREGMERATLRADAFDRRVADDILAAIPRVTE